MSVIDQISSFLSSKPSLEWIGPDIFLLVAVESKETVQQTIVPALIPPTSNILSAVPTVGDVIPFLLPVGLVMTSIGLALVKKLQGARLYRNCATDAYNYEKDFEMNIRRYFKNQSERTISILKGLMRRIPNEEPELVVFFASEESAVTAQNLAMKLMRLIFIAKGEDKKLDEIEEEHVVSGKWYGRFTISWYFLNELKSALTQKKGIIITNFQDVHPNSAALLTFKTNELLSTTRGAHLFLIINVEDPANDPTSNVSPEDSAMDWWLSTRLVPYVRTEVIFGIQKELGDNTCVINKESLSTLAMQ